MAPPAPIDLDALRISTPCPASWDAMKGDARKRFCGQCRLNVYDLSEMTRGDAEALLRKGEGRVCLRLHRRADGRVVTKDCGRVRAALARRVRWARVAAASVLAMLGFTACARNGHEPTPSAGGGGVPPERILMGDVAAPPTPEMGIRAAPPASKPPAELGSVAAPRTGGGPGEK